MALSRAGANSASCAFTSAGPGGAASVCLSRSGALPEKRCKKSPTSSPAAPHPGRQVGEQRPGRPSRSRSRLPAPGSRAALCCSCSRISKVQGLVLGQCPGLVSRAWLAVLRPRIPAGTGGRPEREGKSVSRLGQHPDLPRWERRPAAAAGTLPWPLGSPSAAGPEATSREQAAPAGTSSLRAPARARVHLLSKSGVGIFKMLSHPVKQ